MRNEELAKIEDETRVLRERKDQIRNKLLPAAQARVNALQEEEGFRRESTLFVDDNQTVLKSADTYGVEMLVEISHPDTSEPARETPAYADVRGVADLLDR